MLLAGSKNSGSIWRGLLTLQGLPDIVFAAEPLQGNLRECAGGDLNWDPDFSKDVCLGDQCVAAGGKLYLRRGFIGPAQVISDATHRPTIFRFNEVSQVGIVHLRSGVD